MKLCKRLFFVLALSLLVILPVSCIEQGAHVHTYGEWTMTVLPTETTPGKAVRTCTSDGHEMKMSVAVLTDTSVWTVEEEVVSTCTKEGKVVYASAFGKVEVTKGLQEHEYTEWTILVEPTLTSTGKISRTCKYGETEEVELAVLTDTSVWSVSETVEATCSQEGKVVYTSVYGNVTIVTEKIPHEYGEWTMTAEPTMEATGKAVRTCIYGETEEVDVPALTDTAVWSVSETVEATCSQEGKVVYTSVYGNVTIVTEKIPHEYGEWTMTAEPTMEATGKAVRTCIYGETEEVDVPALTDTAVWTVKEVVDPTYTMDGATVYASVYGEVSVAIEKLALPFAGKTYYAFEIYSRYNFGLINPAAMASVSVTFDENGTTVATSSYPFNSITTVAIVDETTGEISFTAGTSVYKGYMDFESGVMIRAWGSSYSDMIVLVPTNNAITLTNCTGTSWDKAVAFEYNDGEVICSAFIYQEVAYFGVSFEDEKGTQLAASDAATAPVVYVRNALGEVIEAFVNNGTTLVVSDKLEGTYTQGENVLVVSGYGKATYNGVEGSYVKAVADAEYTITLNVEGSYYEVTLNKETYTCEIVKPMVTITFEAGDKAVVPTMEVNKNVLTVLPTPTHEIYTFKGWYYDAECTLAVEEEFIPTENVVLYAKWAEKVVVNLVGVLEEDPTQLLLGVGDVIGEFLPAYDIDEVNMRKFEGWYLDAEFTNTLPTDAELTLDDSGVTVYAKWISLPAYIGNYVGVEVWGKDYGNSSKKVLSIDAEGNMSGVKTGIIVSYDPETQKITYKTSATATTTDSFYFDEATGVIAGLYSSNVIGNDCYIFTKYQTEEDFKLAKNYAVNAPITPESTVTGYYARFANLNTKLGQINIFMYNNHIYSNIVIENIDGEEMTIDQIDASKYVIVRDAETREIIIAIASVGDSFNAQSKTVLLDAYFGTYTNGEETIVLDGTGVITYDEKVGTYTKVDSASYGFDVYFNDNSEYYQLTLEGTSFTIVKPMVTIEFVVGEGHAAIESITWNMNTQVTLPDGAETGYVFNGYFFDQAFTQKVPEAFIPTEDTVLYAKHSLPAVVTIVFNNGEENQEVIYSVGDITNIERPSYAKHIFLGWFTTSAFEEGTEWTSGEAIYEDVTIYAKWEDAPIYNNTYLAIELYGTNANGNISSFYTRTAALLAINEYGHASCSAYPFRGEWDVTNYNEETGTLVLASSSDMYKGYIDKATGIIVITHSSGEDAVFGEVYLLTPFETNTSSDNVSSSYWNSGLTRVIEYTYSGTTYRIFVNENQVYFNVSFTDVLGLPVVGKDAYKAPILNVYNQNGELIAKFGYNSTIDTMQELDGYEGSYTNTTADEGLKGTLELNGIREAILNGKKGTYDLPEEEEATFMFDVYIQGVYYEVSVDKEERTYTIAKPMVILAFNATDKASDMTITTNKYISISLPVLENPEFAFMGWYKDSEFSQKVEGETYRPTKNETLYAKWAKKLTLTLIYNNQLETREVPCVVGVELNMADYAPEVMYSNGKLFKGWFTNEECTLAFTETSLTESTTLYALWEETEPFTIKTTGSTGVSTNNNLKFTYNDTESAWISGNQGESSSKSVITITAIAEVTVTFQYKVSSEARWDKLFIKLNGSTKKEESGTVDYTEFTITLNAGDKLEISYEKDSSGNSGSDQVWIKDLTIANQLVTQIA